MLLAASADFSAAFIAKEPGDHRSRHEVSTTRCQHFVSQYHPLPASLAAVTVKPFVTEDRYRGSEDPQCKSPVQQPHWPPLLSLQTATHHNNQSHFSCYYYYKLRSQSTLHAPESELQLRHCGFTQKINWLQPGYLRQCLTVSNSGHYSSLTPTVTALGS